MNKALTIISNKFKDIIKKYGSEAIWPYYYAGTMGLVQRDSINRLRHYFNFSGQYSTICNTLAATGWVAGTGSFNMAQTLEKLFTPKLLLCGSASTQALHEACSRSWEEK